MRRLALVPFALLLGLALPAGPGEAAPLPPERPEDGRAADRQAEDPVPVPEARPEAVPEAPADADIAAPPMSDAEPDTGSPVEADGPEEVGPADVPLPRTTPDEVETRRSSAPAPAEPATLDTTLTVAETACRARLRDLPAEWTLEDPVAEDGCGIERTVLLTEAAGVRLTPPATLNCRTAEALTLWLRDSVVPAARRHLDARPRGVSVAGSYVCRNRNNRRGGRLSEHAFGNAVDIGGFDFGDRVVNVAARDPKASAALVAFQREIRQAACVRFTTVLGPGADSAHKTHFHLDLRTRGGGYRLCQ